MLTFVDHYSVHLGLVPHVKHLDMGCCMSAILIFDLTIAAQPEFLWRPPPERLKTFSPTTVRMRLDQESLREA